MISLPPNSPAALGRLHKVDLRDIWTTEAGDFTPWLAHPENLSVLAGALGIEQLELEAQEKAVGPFRADLLCKDASTDTCQTTSVPPRSGKASRTGATRP